MLRLLISILVLTYGSYADIFEIDFSNLAREDLVNYQNQPAKNIQSYSVWGQGQYRAPPDTSEFNVPDWWADWWADRDNDGATDTTTTKSTTPSATTTTKPTTSKTTTTTTAKTSTTTKGTSKQQSTTRSKTKPMPRPNPTTTGKGKLPLNEGKVQKITQEQCGEYTMDLIHTFNLTLPGMQVSETSTRRSFGTDLGPMPSIIEILCNRSCSNRHRRCITFQKRYIPLCLVCRFNGLCEKGVQWAP